MRERLVAGDGDQAILDFLTARYGAFVLLLRPPMELRTYVLWYGPAVMPMLGVAAVVTLTLRRWRHPAALQAAPLSEAERRRIGALLTHGEDRAE